MIESGDLDPRARKLVCELLELDPDQPFAVSQGATRVAAASTGPPTRRRPRSGAWPRGRCRVTLPLDDAALEAATVALSSSYGEPKQNRPTPGRRTRHRAHVTVAAYLTALDPNPVLDIRLTGLADAIRDRDWDRVEREYDRVRSVFERELGVRGRPADLFRQGG